MKTAVLCIATNFKIRMKIGNKALLKQEEKIYMSKILKELELWVLHSKEDLVPIVVTCFDEIYEMAVQRHILAFKNEFGFLSEGHVIRFGIDSYPNADSYFILSTSETRIFQAEIFEMLCEHRRNNPNKIVIARVNGRLTLPMVFSREFIEPVRTIVDRENGKFVLRSNSTNALYMDITDEMIQNADFHKTAAPGFVERKGLSSAGTGAPAQAGARRQAAGETSSPEPKPVRSVVLIRGAGRLATSIALTLHRFGYCVLMTEIQAPSTIYRSMSFAQAVYASEIEIGGVVAYLVSPSQIQIQKAWNAGAIPIIIDPDAEVLQLFDQTTVIKSLFNENLIGRPSLDILTYLKNENAQSAPAPKKEKDASAADAEASSFFSQYPLFAVIDAAPSGGGRPTNRAMAPVTIGLREDQQPKEDVLFKIETRPGSLFGKIHFRREIQVAHVDPQRPEDPAACETGSRAEPPTAVSVPVPAPCGGKYRAVRKIGDDVPAGTLIGQVAGAGESAADVLAPRAGRLIGQTASGVVCKAGEVLAEIDSSVFSREDCLQPLPADRTVALAALCVLEGKI